MAGGGAEAAAPEGIYEALRRGILRLEFAPGSELDEGSLSRQFGVSRTPVREALIRLSSEGLVSMQRGRGARVAMLDLGDLRDYFEGLDVLQRAVTRLAAIRRTKDDIQAIEVHLLEFEAGAAAFDSGRTNEANHDFHLAIGHAAHSARLCSGYAHVLAETLRLAGLCFSETSQADERLESHLQKTMRDHRAMFDAICQGDADAAERAAGGHVDLFRNRLVDTLMSTRLTQGISLRA
ncbi:GntR family transcriptional regulator [Lutibaculum baratangense]|uniref:Putative transcriptional regulator protein, AsnC/GntR family n=1 Tax=Lutibaculum baratangense AMV1 TaxID=631454 RepID=V4TJ13_9HYPH|nr:GntR family transcriptional regulator [Lutibaculum baratangense]ESR25913.1 putative transcriptional regulator protein, AsnC/GntR family [Lutibaculum baratangense AMV1]